MKTRSRWATLLVFLLLGFGCALVVGCSSTSSTEETSSAAAEAALNRAVDKLKAAQSYRFEVAATHNWVFEGQEQNWEFSGEGAFAAPNRFRSQMEGPADTFLSIEINGDKIRAWDTRGEVADATTAFGGPGFGTAPYTVIAYLKNFKEATSKGMTSYAGEEAYLLSFTADRASVSAMDAAHANAMERVASVQGEVWIDEAESVIRKTSVEVEFFSLAGQKETVTVTLRFFDFNEPVEFE